MARPLAATLLAVVLLAVGAARAEPPLQLDGVMAQGGLIVGRTSAGAEVRLDGKPLRVSPDGVFVIGFGREHAGSANLAVSDASGRIERQLVIAARSFDVQRIDGLPERQVSPPPDVLQRIKDEAAKVQALRLRDSESSDFAKPWIWPAKGRISGVYGSQRILNGQPRQPHYGIDIAAETGAPVAAANDGVVVLAEPDLYFTGGTVMIDHGHGVSSIYSHLSRVDARPGRRVAQGELIGLVGASGRATGPHLDFRINWLNERIDPQLVLGPQD